MIIRIEAINGRVDKQALETVLNDLQDQGLELFSHQAMFYPSEEQLIEVVIMHKEKE